MQQRGRKSLAQIETPGAVSVMRRPDAPLELTPEETDAWRAIIDAMPADWFPQESWPLLKQYCRHEVCARRLAQLIDAEMSRDPLDQASLKDLLGMQAKETAALKALAASMRLSQQSTYNAQSGATAKNKRIVKRPWD